MPNNQALKYKIVIEGAIAFDPSDLDSFNAAQRTFKERERTCQPLGTVTAKATIGNVRSDSVTETADPAATQYTDDDPLTETAGETVVTDPFAATIDDPNAGTTEAAE